MDNYVEEIKSIIKESVDKGKLVKKVIVSPELYKYINQQNIQFRYPIMHSEGANMQGVIIEKAPNVCGFEIV